MGPSGVSHARAGGGADRGGEVLAALGAQPGGRQLQRLGRDRDGLALVGGAVRDLLLGGAPRELDVVLTRDAASLARELASAIGANATLHGRFGTAVVEWEAGRVDIAERRAESYPAPGALPEVRPGSVEEDLDRRDFTVNAIAVGLGGAGRGELECAAHALEDLARGRLRVLHAGSFIDDPTRLLRLARYRTRLGFEPEPRTAELAAAAVATGALATVSRARVGAELRLALGEPDAVATFAALDALGVLPALGVSAPFDEQLARRALALLPGDGRADLLIVASWLAPLAERPDAERALFELLDGLEFTAGERSRVMGAALQARALAADLALAARPSELRLALSARPLEAVALGGAIGVDGGPPGAGAGEAAREWLGGLRHVRLAITGEDLLAAGVPAGPELGQRLGAALARKLDGELAGGREAELSAALRARV